MNVMSDNGFSPLIISSAHGHLEVVKMLVEAGAEIETEHVEGMCCGLMSFDYRDLYYEV